MGGTFVCRDAFEQAAGGGEGGEREDKPSKEPWALHGHAMTHDPVPVRKLRRLRSCKGKSEGECTMAWLLGN
jgi:hypothetical protein